VEIGRVKWTRSVVLQDIVACINLLMFGSHGITANIDWPTPTDLFLDLSVGPTHNIQNIYDWFILQLLVIVIALYYLTWLPGAPGVPAELRLWFRIPDPISVSNTISGKSGRERKGKLRRLSGNVGGRFRPISSLNADVSVLAKSGSLIIRSTKLIQYRHKTQPIAWRFFSDG
jgi:hypothetical protein